MSIKIMTRVWEESQASGSDLLLLLALADHCDEYGVCWPSQKLLMHKTRQSESTVRRIIDRLVAIGELKVALPSWAERKAGRTAVYTIQFDSGQNDRSGQNDPNRQRSNLNRQRSPVTAKPSEEPETLLVTSPVSHSSSTGTPDVEVTNNSVASQQEGGKLRNTQRSASLFDDDIFNRSQTRPAATNSVVQTDAIVPANNATPASAPPPKSNNKLGQVIDAIRANGIEPIINGARDGKAVKDCSASPEDIAAVYGAVTERRWGTQYHRDSLSIRLACEWVAGYQAARKDKSSAATIPSNRNRPRELLESPRLLKMADDFAKEYPDFA